MYFPHLTRTESQDERCSQTSWCYHPALNRRPPLSALLSQALVAFTIEFDNEFEHLVPHRTTNHGSAGGSAPAPWLVSMVMWLMLMRFVPDEGIDAKELYWRAGLAPKELRMWLVRMAKWWGYLTVTDKFARPTAGGMKALEVWRPLTDVVQKRWQNRVGKAPLDQLLEVMRTIVKSDGTDYPDYLPVLGYPLLTSPPTVKSEAQSRSNHTLPALLSKLLLAFATEFERESNLSLAVCADLLRPTGDEGVPIRQLPSLSGVSKGAIAMALRRAEECDLGIVQRQPAKGRLKIFVLTPQGRRARDKYFHLSGDIEKSWGGKFGKPNVETLRELLEALAGSSSSQPSPLLEWLKPYPDGWRASVPAPAQLPHYPMVLHRGGFPDGS